MPIKAEPVKIIPLIDRIKNCLSMMDFWNMKEEITKFIENKNKKKGVV